MSSHSPKSASLFQPVFSGVLAAIVGFASSFAIVLQGFDSVGASPAQAASGLLALSLGMGLLGIGLSLATRMPISVAWSTPGAALLISTGSVTGGYSAAIGAFIVSGLLIVVAGLWRPFSRAVSSIPMPLAAAMLAGILFELCLAPVQAVSQTPGLALPIVIGWALALAFIRVWAVPVAVVITAVMIAISTPIPADVFGQALPQLIFVVPSVSLDALIGIALPLFVVTMASQNVPGIAVLRTNGYNPPVRSAFVATGAVSAVGAFFGGQMVNLAAITAALCAGPDAHPDPAKRYVAGVTNGVIYVLMALGAGIAAAFVVAAPPTLIQAVAGLALVGTLATALKQAFDAEAHRIPAAATFLTAASGVSIFGIGAAFWGLVVGGALYALLVKRPTKKGAPVDRPLKTDLLSAYQNR